MKKIWLCMVLCLAINAHANNMSQHRALAGFEMPTKRTQTQTVSVQDTEIAETVEETNTPQEKAPHTLNPRAHPKHRAGLHK